jgi:hypothetical protein
MIYNTFKNLLFVSSLLASLAFASCQKGVDINDPDIIPGEVKDSTLLIKSISRFANTDEDSLTEYYSYDTVNRKITLTWDDPSESYFPDGSQLELSYNAAGLLVHVAYKYPLGYTQWEYDYNIIDITYDADKILQSITTKYSNGSIESKVFSKTRLSSGNYQLTWDETNLPDDKIFRKAVFDAEGKTIVNIIENSFIAETSPTGDDIFTNYIATDSLVYDASGSVIKIISSRVDTLRHTNDSYISYDFTRQTKGDQLYKQRQIIMNGIANMPFGNFDSPEDAFGVLSFSVDNEYLQYSKYPMQTAKVHMWDGSYKNFIAPSEFDNKNRLTKFTGFFHDYDLEPQEYRINYYK